MISDGETILVNAPFDVIVCEPALTTPFGFATPLVFGVAPGAGDFAVDPVFAFGLVVDGLVPAGFPAAFVPAAGVLAAVCCFAWAPVFAFAAAAAALFWK